MRSGKRIDRSSGETLLDIGAAPANHCRRRLAQLDAEQDPMEQEVAQFMDQPIIVEAAVAHSAPQRVGHLAGLSDQPEGGIDQALGARGMMGPGRRTRSTKVKTDRRACRPPGLASEIQLA
jgi:hypothetical protein